MSYAQVVKKGINLSQVSKKQVLKKQVEKPSSRSGKGLHKKEARGNRRRNRAATEAKHNLCLQIGKEHMSDYQEQDAILIARCMMQIRDKFNSFEGLCFIQQYYISGFHSPRSKTRAKRSPGASTTGAESASSHRRRGEARKSNRHATDAGIGAPPIFNVADAEEHKTETMAQMPGGDGEYTLEASAVQDQEDDRVRGLEERNKAMQRQMDDLRRTLANRNGNDEEPTPSSSNKRKFLVPVAICACLAIVVAVVLVLVPKPSVSSNSPVCLPPTILLPFKVLHQRNLLRNLANLLLWPTALQSKAKVKLGGKIK